MAPAGQRDRGARPVEVEGWALAGRDRHVERVEVSGDGGRRWTVAELLDGRGRWAWRRWRTRLNTVAGRAEIVVRAWDSAAAVQPNDPASLWNPRGYANAACPRVVVTVR
jgi:sulfite oxidase